MLVLLPTQNGLSVFTVSQDFTLRPTRNIVTEYTELQKQ